MNAFSIAGAALMAAALVAPLTVSAQYVHGNEAVQAKPDGSNRVEIPPTAGALLAKPCPAVNPGCSGSGWKMVETVAGLQECTEPYARESTCRASTYGTQKLTRVWVVKKGGHWLQCQLPDVSGKCVGLKSLPFAAVQ